MDERDPVILSEEQYEALLEAAKDSKNSPSPTCTSSCSERRVCGATARRSGFASGTWISRTDSSVSDRAGTATGLSRETADGSRSRYGSEKPYGTTSPSSVSASTTASAPLGSSTTSLPSRRRSPGTGSGLCGRRSRGPLRGRSCRGTGGKHDLRHRRVTTWLSAGHSPVKVQKAMGHSDLKTIMSYYTFVRSDLESLVTSEELEKKEIPRLG